MSAPRSSARLAGLALLVLLGGCFEDPKPPTGGDGEESGGDGDGDGDPSTGDGDGDPSTGDGDPSTGDGDGDPSTGDGDGDPSTGDGDGDPSTGDGDGDNLPPGACDGPEDCLATEYCDFADDFCGELSLGECQPRPDIESCPFGFEVTGCDCEVYPGTCEAAAMGMDFKCIGNCC